MDQLYPGDIFKATSATEESVSFGVYNGNVSLTIWRKGERQPAVKKTLNAFSLTCLKNLIKRARSLQPESKTTMEFNKYNPGQNGERGTWNLELVLGIGLTDKQIFFLEISGPTITPPIRVPFKGSGGISFDATPMVDADKSKTAFEVFSEAISRATAIAAISSTKIKEAPAAPQYGNKGGSNRGGGNQQSGGNRSGGGGSESADDYGF